MKLRFLQILCTAGLVVGITTPARAVTQSLKSAQTTQLEITALTINKLAELYKQTKDEKILEKMQTIAQEEQEQETIRNRDNKIFWGAITGTPIAILAIVVILYEIKHWKDE